MANKKEIENSKAELARLEKEDPNNKDAITKQKAEIKMREGLVATGRDEVSAKLMAAQQAQKDLADPDKAKAIQTSLDALVKANKQEADSKSAVEKFAEEIKTARPELKNKEIKTKKDLMDLIVPSEEQLKYVAERRASLVGMTDKTEIARVEKEISDKIKESGANEGKFNAVTDVNKVEAVLDKLKDLNGEEKQFLENKAGSIGKAYDAAEKEFTKVDKDRLENLDSKVSEGLSSKETIERNELLQKESNSKATYAGIGDEKDRARYAELKDRDKKKLTVEDEETLKVAEKQLGLKPGEARALTPGQLRAVESQRTQRAEKDPAFNQRVQDLIKQNVSAEDAKTTALKELGDKDAKMVAAIGGVEGLKAISAAEKVSLARDAGELDIILQDKNTALSPTMAKALEASAKLKSSDPSKNNGATENLTNFFRDNLGTTVKKEDVDKTYQANREVGNKLASTINLGGARAAELAGVGKDGKDGKEASPQQRMSELRKLLEKDDKDPKLTESEKKLRAGLKSEGITKDIFTKDGNIDVKKFNEAAESMGKKQKEEAAANARKESSNVVSLDDRTLKALSNKEMILSGNITVKGDLSATARSATPPPSKG